MTKVRVRALSYPQIGGLTPQFRFPRQTRPACECSTSDEEPGASCACAENTPTHSKSLTPTVHQLNSLYAMGSVRTRSAPAGERQPTPSLIRSTPEVRPLPGISAPQGSNPRSLPFIAPPAADYLTPRRVTPLGGGPVIVGTTPETVPPTLACPGPDPDGSNWIRLMGRDAGAALFVSLNNEGNTSVPYAALERDGLAIPGLIEFATPGGRFVFGAVGRIGQIRQHIDNQKRIFLFSGDLATGIKEGLFMQVPQPDFCRVATFQTFDVPSSHFWTSLRVYDSGRCSLRFPWDTLITELFEELDPALRRGDNPIPRISDAIVKPIFRAPRRWEAPVSGLDGDTLSMEFRVDLGDVESCDEGTTANIKLRLGLERVTGRLDPRPCDRNICDADPGFFDTTGILCSTTISELSPSPRDLEGTFDFPGVVDATIGAPEPRGECGAITAVFETGRFGDVYAGDVVRRRIRNGIERRLPGIIRRVIRNKLLISPTAFAESFGAFGFPVSIDAQRCLCDAECDLNASRLGTRVAYPGFRHRCDQNELQCHVQLEPKRFNIRPDGLEVVLAENEDDVQFELLMKFAPDGMSSLGRLGAPNRGTAFASRTPPLFLPAIVVPARFRGLHGGV